MNAQHKFNLRFSGTSSSMKAQAIVTICVTTVPGWFTVFHPWEGLMVCALHTLCNIKGSVVTTAFISQKEAENV